MPINALSLNISVTSTIPEKYYHAGYLRLPDPCTLMLHCLIHTNPDYLISPGSYQEKVQMKKVVSYRIYKWSAEPTHTGKSTLTSVPSRRDTRHVMMDLESPAAGMCVAARWASRSLSFSACLRIDRRPSVLRKKLSIFVTNKTRDKKVLADYPQCTVRQMVLFSKILWPLRTYC